MVYPQIQVAVAPTGLILSFRSGDPATYESVTAPVRLDQASEVRCIRHQRIMDELDPIEAPGTVADTSCPPVRYSLLVVRLA